MRYRVTLVDAPPDFPFREIEEFKDWQKTLDHILFVSTRAKRRWSAIALESRRIVPVGGGKGRDAEWRLAGYAGRTAIDGEIAKAEAAEATREHTRSRIWRLLQRGRAKGRKGLELDERITMAYQGSLDGLCGPYAIINAYHLCGIDEDWLGQDIFKIACSEIGNWPDVLWKGTTFRQMETMLKACQKALRKVYREENCKYSVKIEYPFRSNPPRSRKKYLKRFNEIFSRDNAICGIVGMEKPDAHWFSFVKGKKTLSAFDSAPPGLGGMRRIRLKDVHAGAYRKKKIVLAPKELIVFREA